MDRMRDGQWHLPGQTGPREENARTFTLVSALNELQNTDPEAARKILRELLPNSAHVPGLHVPLNLEMGANVTVGQQCFINFGATILAQAPVTLGDHVMIGPNCSLITVGHPVNDHEMRKGGWEIARPISIGDNTWLGANVTVLPGVSIGQDCVIGAGALVTRDVPDRSLVLGAPGRVVRVLEDQELERVDLDGPVEGFGANAGE